MNTAVAEITSKSPAACSNIEVGALIAFIRAGGEVANHGLTDRISGARSLVFAHLDGRLVGVSALKLPVPSYRRRVSSSSGVALSPGNFPYELGWVYVQPMARGKGLALALSRAALNAAQDHGVFATSRTDNEAMHRTLARLGFALAGSSFPSGRKAHEIQVFVRHAAQPCHAADSHQRASPAGSCG